MNTDERRLNELTEKIIGCAFEVSNRHGCGYLEMVYHNSLKVELELAGLKVASKHPINVFYRGVLVGIYEADLLVEGCVLVEVKAVKALDEIHMAQCPTI